VPGLIDSHCHLDYAPMADDLEGTLARAAAAGVEALLHIGCALASHERALALVDRDPRIFAAIGLHPHEANTIDDAAMARVEHALAHPKVLAIGETGLDYHYDRAPRRVQADGFVRHLELARAHDLPIVLHVRDAHDDALALVAAHPPRASAPGIVHCFTGTPDEARRWLDLGFHVSFSGIATFKTAGELREAAKLVPADRILLETDAPFLAPVPLRGRPNEPANVAHTCIALAAVRGEPPETLARQAADNTRALLAHAGRLPL
jgi:TatD DNase family protein